MHTRTLLGTAAAALLLAAPAMAQVSATAATDLNLRSGPNGSAEILSVIPTGGAVTVQGCVADASWCQVDFEGTAGWAYGEYLTAVVEGQPDPVVVIENREPLQVTAVEAPDPGAGAGALAGATAAATLIGGPAAILAGAALGAAAGDALTPESAEVAYVVANPVEPMLMEGEVVLGAGIPPEVELTPIPDSTSYAYLNVNGQPVIVNTSDRQIVYVVR